MTNPTEQEMKMAEEILEQYDQINDVGRLELNIALALHAAKQEGREEVERAVETCQASILNELNGCQQPLEKMFDIVLNATRSAAHPEQK